MMELLEKLVIGINTTNVNFEFKEHFSVLQTPSAVMNATVKIDVQHMIHVYLYYYPCNNSIQNR